MPAFRFTRKAVSSRCRAEQHLPSSGPRMSEQFSFHLLIPVNFVVDVSDGTAQGR